MQANSWHHEFFHFHLLFWIWQVWKGMKKLQKFEYLENEKSFRWNENTFFIVFEGLSFGEKRKLADRNIEKITIFQIVDIYLDFSNQINFELGNINDPEWHVFFYFEMSLSVTFPVKLVWRQLKKFWSKNNFQFLKRMSEKVCKWCIIIANFYQFLKSILKNMYSNISVVSFQQWNESWKNLKVLKFYLIYFSIRSQISFTVFLVVRMKPFKIGVIFTS